MALRQADRALTSLLAHYQAQAEEHKLGSVPEMERRAVS